MYTPFVIEKSATGERSYDIWSRLLKDRIVFLGTGVDDFVANSLIAQMMFLDKEDRNMPIEFYINSPGGSVSAGLAITTLCIPLVHLLILRALDWPLLWVQFF